MFFMLADRRLSSEAGLTGLSKLPKFGLQILIICSNLSPCIRRRWNIGNVVIPLMYYFVKNPRRWGGTLQRFLKPRNLKQMPDSGRKQKYLHVWREGVKEDVLRNSIFTNKSQMLLALWDPSFPYIPPEQSWIGEEVRENKLHRVGCAKVL